MKPEGSRERRLCNSSLIGLHECGSCLMGLFMRLSEGACIYIFGLLVSSLDCGSFPSPVIFRLSGR